MPTKEPHTEHYYDYVKLVVLTTQQHVEQILIIIHVALSERFNLSTQAGIYIPFDSCS